MKKILPITLAIMGAGVAAYFFLAQPFSQKEPANETRPSSELKVNPALADNEEKTFIRRETKTELTITSAAGEKFELKLPANSLPENDLVKMRQIEKMDNLPAGAEFVAGAELAPDGVNLTGNGLLQITLPNNIATKNLLGFSYHGQGEDFHFYPVKFQGQTAVFQLSGFSGYGILDVGSADVPIIRSSKQIEAIQKLAILLLNKSRSQAAGGPENWTEEETGQILGIFQDWFENSVKPRLLAALENDRLALSAIYEYVSWLGWTQWFGVDDKLSAMEQQGKQLCSAAIDNALFKAGKRCAEKKDPSQAGLMLKYHGLAVFLGMEGQAADFEQVKKTIAKCVNFKLTLKSKLTIRLATAENKPDIVEVSGEAPITMSPELTLSGNGLIKIDKFVNGVAGKECRLMKPFNFSFDVPKTVFQASPSDNKKLTIFLDFRNDNNFPVEYPLMAGEPPNDSSQMSRELTADIAKSRAANYFDCHYYIGTEFAYLYPSLPWLDDFFDAHADEGKELGGLILKITDWEFVGGNVYARKIYEREKNLPYRAITENTVLELLSEPK